MLISLLGPLTMACFNQREIFHQAYTHRWPDRAECRSRLMELAGSPFTFARRYPENCSAVPSTACSSNQLTPELPGPNPSDHRSASIWSLLIELTKWLLE
jgi:hypothetical protein